MCQRFIEHWSPCHHMRLSHTIPCITSRGTVGQRYEDCPKEDNSYFTEPSKTECPICLRNEAFEEHFGREGQSSAQGSARQPQVKNNVTPRSSARRLRSNEGGPSQSYQSAYAGADAASTVSALSVCGLGEHDFVHIDGSGLRCVECGTIRGETHSNIGSTSSRVTPLASFADDDEGDGRSTLSGWRSTHGSDEYQRQIIGDFDRQSATHSTRGTEARESAMEEAASPTPSAMSSNARAKNSWKAYESALGRRLPNF